MPVKTPDQYRRFYDDLYKRAEKRNPAYEIYDRLRANYISALAKGSPGPVLIVGCGSNRDLEIMGTDSEVFAFDLSIEAVRKLSRDRVSLFTADALRIPFEDEAFNLVICSEVLEHIPDIRSAVKEMRRVVKPGGTLIVSSPNWISWFGLARWLAGSVFGKQIHSDDQPYDDWKTWKRYQQELGPEFEVVASRGVWYLPPLHFRKYGIPGALMKAIYFMYAPFERLLSRWLPAAGHLLILKCRAK
ncbi:MAG: methyltransferase domain-containing protein [Chloroflexi bacterium]|nr:methyltransferase domain-containing protein [Chloroflexota bacterium]